MGFQPMGAVLRNVVWYPKQEAQKSHRRSARSSPSPGRSDKLPFVDAHPEIPAPLSSHEIAGYTIVEELPPAQPFLALAHGNRQVVLKPIAPDCLVVRPAGVKLHPSIRDRLARVRELAHARVANLHGV